MRNDECLNLLVIHALCMKQDRKLNTWPGINRIQQYFITSERMNKEMLSLKIKYPKICREHQLSSILTDRRLNKLLEEVAKEFERDCE